MRKSGENNLTNEKDGKEHMQYEKQMEQQENMNNKKI